MSSSIRHKYKYFHSTLKRAKDRRQKFHFCRLPFDVGPRNVRLNLSIISCNTAMFSVNLLSGKLESTSKLKLPLTESDGRKAKR